MKILFLTLASLALGNSLLSAQVGETFISPGVRCGYTFGDRGGFTLGVELSVTRRVGVDTYAGMLVDVYAVGAMKMVHVGAEATYHFVGLSLGPTFAETPEGTRVGYSLIAYGLFIVMP
ncbi:MAG TPA: hypothetical protein VL221_04990 [Bacteroidota bacterium]|nr:hypothetical protein [Bacteroidota bacterium]